MSIIVTMAFHPTGGDLFDPAGFQRAARLILAVHALALVTLPVWFFGGAALTRRIGGKDPLPRLALTVWGMGLVAAMIAAAASGLLAPSLAEALREGGSEASLWDVLFHFNGMVNRAFARIFVGGSAISVTLWSVGIVRSRNLGRALGMSGLVLGPLIFLALVSGHVRMDVHGFGAIMLAEALWFIAAGVLLVRQPA